MVPSLIEYNIIQSHILYTCFSKKIYKYMQLCRHINPSCKLFDNPTTSLLINLLLGANA